MTLPKQSVEDAVQLYMEGRLTEADRETFLSNLDADEQEDLQAADSPLRALERLPRKAAPNMLGLNVMASIAPKRQPLPARVRTWLDQHALLGWQVGGMAVAASILVMVLTLQITPSMHGVAVAQISCSQVVTQNPVAAGHATFCLYAPQATTVALIGDFNGWGSEQRVELRRQGDALWTVDLPLTPGNYQYAFVIDDKKTITDPRAEQHVNDDFGRKNAVISVS